jgi:cysteate synthase
MDRRLACDTCGNALLRTVYAETRFEPSSDAGIFRFKSWLPGDESFFTTVGPTIVASERYAARLGLKRLFIAYNGYCPERGAFNVTASFKDLEAGPTIAYLRGHGVRGIVLASAGNTARAFAYAASEANFPCLIVVPERMAHRLWLPRKAADCVQSLVLRESASYNAAIRVSQDIARRFDIAHEGGVRNVARRDGMGTTVLEFARVTGGIPRHYVQAVGSGAGAIAAYEASLRLIADGRFGTHLPMLHLAQNEPIAIIHDKWSARHRTDADPIERAPADVRQMYADVLANYQPAYDVIGGVRTALTATNGSTCAVTRRDAERARARFEQAEGLAINEAAACACAALERTVAKGLIDPSDSVLLNITGGGEELVRRDFDIHHLAATYSMEEDGKVEHLDLDFVHEYAA